MRRPEVGSPLPTPIQNQDLMSHQDGLGNDGPESTRLNQPDDGNDRTQKERENVAHAQDGIRLKKPYNSVRFRNSPTTGKPDTSAAYVAALYTDMRSQPPPTRMFMQGCSPGLETRIERLQARDMVMRKPVGILCRR